MSKALLLLPRGSVESAAVLAVAGVAGFLSSDLEIVYTDSEPATVHIKSAEAGDVSGAAAVVRALCRMKARVDLLAEANPQHAAQVEELLSWFSTHKVASHLSTLNARVLPSVFLTGSVLTAADIVVYAAAHAPLKAADEKTRATLPNLVRWFDHVQHIPAIRSFGAGLPVVTFIIPPVSAAFGGDFVPVAAAAAPAKDEKKAPKPAASAAPAAAAAASSSAAAPAAAAVDADAAAKRKAARAQDKAVANKDEKKKERPLSKKELAAQNLPITKLELKVGKITKAVAHPTEAKLYVETVDCGEGAGKERVIVSTFADYFPLASLTNKLAVVATNLEVADIKGVKSTGRIFDVQKDGKKEWLTVPAGAKVGERITFPGAGEAEPDKEIPSKKFRDILKDFGTNDSKVAVYRDIAFTTSAGPCTTATFVGAKIG